MKSRTLLTAVIVIAVAGALCPAAVADPRNLAPCAVTVAVINPKTATVESTFHVSLCGPAGLTLGPNQDLLIGCSAVCLHVGDALHVRKADLQEQRRYFYAARNYALEATQLGERRRAKGSDSKPVA